MSARRRTSEEVTIRFEKTGQEVPASITNMSVDGAGFTLQEMPVAKEPITLVMRHGSRRVEIAAIVRWVEPAGKGWRAGCRFDQKLDIAPVGAPDRTTCAVPVTYRLQGNPKRHPVVLRNFSESGTCLETNDELVPNDRIFIECDEGHRFSA